MVVSAVGRQQLTAAAVSACSVKLSLTCYGAGCQKRRWTLGRATVATAIVKDRARNNTEGQGWPVAQFVANSVAISVLKLSI